MIGFLDISQVIVPRGAVEDIQTFLRAAGTNGVEGFGVWVGRRRDEQTFVVLQTLIPGQRGYRTPSGLLVMIEPSQLHALNVWLQENQQSVIAQIHSHPTEAYHSTADDELAIATVAGSFSFVVPDFARAPFSLSNWASYRLSAAGLWEEVDLKTVSSIVTIID